jgi:hypothetical protein
MKAKEKVKVPLSDNAGWLNVVIPQFLPTNSAENEKHGDNSRRTCSRYFGHSKF